MCFKRSGGGWGQTHIRTKKWKEEPPPPPGPTPPPPDPPSPSSDAGGSLSWGPGKFFWLTVSGATRACSKVLGRRISQC